MPRPSEAVASDPVVEDISRLPEALLDALDVGVVVMDRELRITYANQRAEEIVPNLVGRTGFDSTWELVDSEGDPLAIQDAPAPLALSTGVAQRGVVVGARPDEQEGWIWLRVSAVPRIGASGASESVVLTLSDASAEQRRHAEVASSRREAMYRAILNAASEGALIRGKDGSLQYANPAALRILGLTQGQLEERGSVSAAWDLVDAEGNPLPPDRMPTAVTQRTGQQCRGVLLGLRRGDGTRAWLIVSTLDLGAEGVGAEGSVVATFSDVTRLRETNIALERSRERFERITRTVPGVLYQAILGKDGSFYLPFVSAAAKDVLGMGAAEIVARPERLLDCIDEVARQRLALAAQQAQAEGKVLESDVLLEPPGQPPRWVRNRAVPQRVGSDVIWSGVAFDVTDERRLAEQVRVAQRREAVGSVTAGIAHNFNNALAVLIPNLEHCLDSTSTDQEHLLLESLQTARAAADLVRQLMVVASSGLIGDRMAVDIVPVIRETLAMFRRLVRGRVEVREHLPDLSVRIESSAGALQQILLNLCINAQDALRGVEDGGVDVSLQIDPGGRDAMLSVRDNGCGMDEDTRRRIGEPFFTTKDPGVGTGLGLATVYATVQELGGTIECSSVPGNGSQFTIKLPVFDAKEATPPPPPTEAIEHCPVARILVVDDEALVRSAVARSLSKAGHAVEQCSSGAEALQRIRNAPVAYDLMLLDLSMPGLSGESVLGTLGIEHPDLPIIVLTGFVEDRDAIAHARDVLLKPASSRDITKSVARVLAGAT